jgi:hypothetical protein
LKRSVFYADVQRQPRAPDRILTLLDLPFDDSEFGEFDCKKRWKLDGGRCPSYPEQQRMKEIQDESDAAELVNS